MEIKCNGMGEMPGKEGEDSYDKEIEDLKFEQENERICKEDFKK